MKLAVARSIAERYPALRIGYVVADGVDNHGSDPALTSQLSAAEAEARRSFPTAEDLARAPAIAAWREIYRSFGANPSQTRPSAEAVLRRVVRGDALPAVSRLVDSYLTCQLGDHLPIGGYDLDRVAGTIALRHSPGGEAFVAIGGDASATNGGEVVYADAERVLTRRWNHRDCDAAKITEDSTRVALFIEAPVPAITDDQLDRAIARLAQAIATACGGRLTSGALRIAESLETELRA